MEKIFGDFLDEATQLFTTQPGVSQNISPHSQTLLSVVANKSSWCKLVGSHKRTQFLQFIEKKQNFLKIKNK
jgi:hypothetical protein